MTDRERELEAAKEAVLAFLLGRGIRPEQVILGITDTEPDDDDAFPYTTHVGPTEDPGTAALVSLVAGDLHHEAGRQGVALVKTEQVCPACGSPRYGPNNMSDPDNPYRHIRRNACLNCDHEDFPEP